MIDDLLRLILNWKLPAQQKGGSMKCFLSGDEGCAFGGEIATGWALLKRDDCCWTAKFMVGSGGGQI